MVLVLFKTLQEIQSLITSLGFSFLTCNIKVLVQMIFNVPFNFIELKLIFLDSVFSQAVNTDSMDLL